MGDVFYAEHRKGLMICVKTSTEVMRAVRDDKASVVSEAPEFTKLSTSEIDKIINGGT
jgi:hypothetical protein